MQGIFARNFINKPRFPGAFLLACKEHLQGMQAADEIYFVWGYHADISNGGRNGADAKRRKGDMESMKQSQDFTPYLINKGKRGEWGLNRRGKQLARDLAKNSIPLAAKQQVLLFAEVEKLRLARDAKRAAVKPKRKAKQAKRTGRKGGEK